MRVGLIGSGRIGAFHARTLIGHPGVDSVVLADADAPRARAVAAELGADAVDTTDELFDAGPDAVVVAAATAAHAGLLLRAAEAGLPVFCEKPVAPSVVEHLAVMHAVEAAGIAVHVGFQRRFDAGYAAARAAVRSGELGWVHTLRAGTLDPAPPPAAYVPLSGGLFRDCSVHDIDAVRWVTGTEVREVYATGANHGADFFREAGDVDAGAALLTMEDDAFALLSGTRYNARGCDVRLEVLGSLDSVSVGLDDRLPLRSVEPGVEFPAGRPWALFMERFEPAYRAELAAFVQMAAGERESPCTVRDSLQTALVAEACEVSRRERRPVQLAALAAEYDVLVSAP
ncbi:dehydrogenase [Modestobacter sp. I12A-02628]|uniref:Gfo/Idh/MocA family oxidoreductase n=1 Tax=Goekera deserti TaxID=2497753 RepID=A0A7K3WBU3_9ACTN|nr:Gfo/Idh/MocA family oxidoreductase [Goekera deserti]MPQ98703.1 dehydrogenase [Goekera deserti]NDI49265.1 Gfo/Idh/MocA family oxidoreductase [Goekera deserti]NEL53003.1 Gfo/Idh/MocA family oxidoreductase [Goekera deserti]